MKFVARELKDTADISRGKFQVADFMKGVLSAVVIVIAIYLLITLLINIVAAKLPDHIENDWLAAPYRDSFYRMRGDEVERVEHSLQQLLQDMENPRRLDYRIVVFEDPQINAFAFPGGGIAVTRGFLENVTAEAEIAFVIAHELAHHERRHLLKNFLWKITWAVIAGFIGADEIAAANLLAFANQTQYSRDLEKEADLFAAQLVRQIYGDDPELYIGFFQKIPAHFSAELLPWFSTHPKTEQRIEYIRQALQTASD